MSAAFDRVLGRLLLECCRLTYAQGAGGPGNHDDLLDADKYIGENSGRAVTGKRQATHALQGTGPGSTSKASVLIFDNMNVVSYMGTVAEFKVDNPGDFLLSLKDWVQDAKSAPVAFELDAASLGGVRSITLPGLVHRGFLQELTAIQSQVFNVLKTHGGTKKPIVVTGHSQGGGEACLATAALAAAGYHVSTTYTFAAARAGNGEFVRHVNSRGIPVHRLEFGDDIVPHLPPVAIRRTLETWAATQSALLALTCSKVLDNIRDYGYEPLGALTYGHQSEGRVHVSMSPDAEKVLFAERLKWLVQAPSNWGDHHHLAGTKKETAQSHRGNYTALVDPGVYGWPLA